MSERTRLQLLAAAATVLIDELSETEVVGPDEALAANEYRGLGGEVLALSDCTVDGMTRSWRGRFGPVLPHFLALSTIEGWDKSDPVRGFCLSFHQRSLARKIGVGS